MALSLGIALALVAVLSLVLMRVTVGFLARGADNGWDNAFTYVLCTALAWAGLVGMVMPMGLLPFALGAIAMPAVQVGLIRWIYELRTGRSVVVALVHTTVGATLVGGLTLTAGVIAAYVIYGRIIDDPMILVRLILQLLGLLPPGA